MTLFQCMTGNAAAENRQLSALSNAWSCTLLDHLTTLAPVQSNNGEPSRGPKAHSSAIELVWLHPLSLTSHPPGPRIQDRSTNTQCGIHEPITGLIWELQTWSACWPTHHRYFLFWCFSSFCVGGGGGQSECGLHCFTKKRECHLKSGVIKYHSGAHTLHTKTGRSWPKTLFL